MTWPIGRSQNRANRCWQYTGSGNRATNKAISANINAIVHRRNMARTEKNPSLSKPLNGCRRATAICPAARSSKRPSADDEQKLADPDP